MSKIKNKLVVALTLIAVMFSSLSLVMMGSVDNKAYATETEVFELQDGAKVGFLGLVEGRGDEEFLGIRWTTEINKAYCDKLLSSTEGTYTFGTLIAPSSAFANVEDLEIGNLVYNEEKGEYYTSAGVYVSNIVNENAAITLQGFENGSDKLVLHSAIRYTELIETATPEKLAEAYKMDLVARSYIGVTSGGETNYFHSDEIVIRNLYDTANAHVIMGDYTDENTISLLDSIVLGETVERVMEEDGYFYANKTPDTYTFKFDGLVGEQGAVRFTLGAKAITPSFNSATGEVTLSGDLFTIDTCISAFVGDKIYAKKILKATAISTADEFVGIFKLTDDGSTVSSLGEENILNINTFADRYVLTNNIDLTDKTFTGALNITGHLYNNAEYSYKVATNWDTCGLTGTFDGQGYAVYNMTANQGGLFGVINGVVKNVAFINADIKFGDAYSNRNGILAQQINALDGKTLIKNVYLSSSAVHHNNKTLLAMIVDYTTAIENCYFAGNQVLTGSTSNYEANGSGYYSTGFMFNGNTKLDATAKNVIVVSDYFFGSQNNAGSYKNNPMDASADGSTTTMPLDYGGTRAESIGSSFRAKGTIYRYENVDTLKAYYASNENAKTVIDTFGNNKYFIKNDAGEIAWAKDFSLEATNVAMENNSVSLSLTAGDVDNPNTASFIVKNALGGVVTGFDFAVESEAVATVDENGVVTAKGKGDTTLIISKNGVVYFTVAINVYKVKIDKSETINFLVDADGEIINTTLLGESILGCTTEVEGVSVSIAENGLMTIAGATAGNVYVVEAETEKEYIKFSVQYVSAITYIYTADQFIETFNLAKTGTDAADFASLNEFDGYYVLGNNIDLTGKTFKSTFSYAGAFTTYVAAEVDSTAFGLTGTLEGQGYAIKNLVAPNGGIFGTISGTVKNVAFINADVNNVNGTTNVVSGILGKFAYTTAEISNVYLKTSNTEYTPLKQMLTSYGDRDISINDSYFEGEMNFMRALTSGTSYYAGTFTNESNSAIIVSKYVISTQREWFVASGDGNANGSSSLLPLNNKGVRALDYNNGDNSTTYISARAAGQVYRYESVVEMAEMYETNSYVSDLVDTFAENKYYTVKNNKIAWANDIDILVDSEIATSVTINLGDTKTIAIKDGFGDDATGFMFDLVDADGEFTVENGEIKANSVGEGKIVAKKNDVVYATLNVNVVKPVQARDYTITLDSTGDPIDTSIITETITDVEVVGAENVSATYLNGVLKLVGAEAGTIYDLKLITEITDDVKYDVSIKANYVAKKYTLYVGDQVVTGDTSLEIALGDEYALDVKYDGESATGFSYKLNDVAVENSVLTVDTTEQVTLNVYRNGELYYTVTLTAVKETVDLSASYTALVDVDGEELDVTKLGGEPIGVSSESVTAIYEDGKLKLDGATVNTTYDVTVETANKNIKIKATHYTAVIKTAEEFVSTFDLIKDGTTSDHPVNLNTFDGYYVLANNIDFAGKTMPTDTLTSANGSYNDLKEDYDFFDADVLGMVGLTGTFDGRGYAIKNIVAPEGGLFGAISGTIKNVAFMDADVNTPDRMSGILAKQLYNSATLENVYLKVADTCEYSVNKQMLAPRVAYGVKLNNSYFEGNMHFIFSPSWNGNGTKVGYAGVLTTKTNSYIVVSNYVIGVVQDDNGKPIEGIVDNGYTTTEAPINITGTPATPTHYMSGTVYRYGTASEMIGNNVSAVVTTAMTNTGYFTYNDATGVVGWASDYSVAIDNQIVIDDITLYLGDVKSIVVKDSLGNEATGFEFELVDADGKFTVVDGTITAISEGEGKLIAKKDGVVYANLTVKVTKPVQARDYTITLDSTGEPIDTSIITENIVDVEVVGTENVSVTYVDGVLKLVGAEAGTTYDLTLITDGNYDVSIKATYVAKKYTLYVGDQVVTGDTSLEVALGDEIALAVKYNEAPATGFAYKLNGVDVVDSTITLNDTTPATLTVYRNGEVYYTVTITAVKETVDLSASYTALVDDDGEFLDATKVGAGLLTASTTADGVTATVTVDGKLKLEGATVNTTYTVTVETATKIATIKATHYTAVIKTAEEFVSTFDLVKDGTTSDHPVNLNTFGGYYVLANDIDFAGENMPTDTLTSANGSYGVATANWDFFDADVKGVVGLTGTFDGRGYAIKNIVAPEGGLFGAISGTIKNVAFINADVNTPDRMSGILAKQMYGGSTVQNVYLKVADTCEYSANKQMLAPYVAYGVKLNNNYFEGDMHLIYIPTWNGNGSVLGYAGVLTSGTNSYIVVSKYNLGMYQGNFDNVIEGVLDNGYTEGEGESIVYKTAQGIAYNGVTYDISTKTKYMSGTAYRYGSASEMIGNTVSSVVTTAMTNTGYFTYDDATGVVGWASLAE